MFVAWRDLRSAKGRFALIGSAVVLITLMVGLLSGLTDGLRGQNVSAIEGLSADRVVFNAPPGGGGPSYTESTLTDAQIQGWASAPGVRSAQPLGITLTAATTATARQGVSVFGVADGSTLAPGGAPVPHGTAVLSQGAADKLKLHAGDTLTVAGQPLTVSAVRGDAYFSHTPVVWTGLDVWRKAVPPAADGSIPAASVVAVDTGSGFSAHATQTATGTTSRTVSGSLSAIGSYTSENGSLQLMRGFLFAISALVVGAFFTVWTIQRSGDIAVLKALGASTASLLKDALGQAFVLLTLGTLVGTGLAAAGGALVSGTSVPFTLTPGTMAGPALVMVVLGMLGAALSVRRITSVDPLTALGSAR